MDTVYEELDGAKAEIEKLRTEYRTKAELSETLKRAHNEHLIKLQEVSSKLEKQAQELNEKADEISVVKQMYEDLKCNLKEKEAIIKHLSAAHDKVRVDCDEKLRKCKEENRGLIVALDEANEKNMDQEQRIHGFKEEIEGLKGLVSVSHKKCAEAEKKAKASKETRQRNGVLLQLEDENRKVEDQLKWKKEQFKHLEEAHIKLQDQLRVREKEWEREKSTLLDEISMLQTNLDSQTRISEDLQSRLQMCNQALAHQESRRKYLEVQLSESKRCFNSLSTECEDANSKIECLTGQRDKEIAILRDLLGTKETLFKEMKYQVAKLDGENQELIISIKELQEAQIQEAGSSSLSKLRSKLKVLEQMHKDSSKNLKAKEAEYCFELGKLTKDLNCCRSELEIKVAAIKELELELEDCQSLIMQLALQNEETSLMLLVLQMEFLELQSKFAHEKAADMNLENKEREDNISLLTKQLELKNAALVKAQTDIEEERNRVVMLSRKVKALSFIEQQQLPLQKEFDRHKQLLRESSACQLSLKEQVLKMKSDLKKVCLDLDTANSELTEKFLEGGEILFELQIWKSIAERLKANLEENHRMRREVEASLLAQVVVEVTLKQEKEKLAYVLEEKDRRIDELEQQLVVLDQELKTRETDNASPTTAHDESVKDSGSLPSSKEKKKISEDIQKEIEWFENEWLRSELEEAIFAQIDAEERTPPDERDKKENLHHLVEEKDRKIESSTITFSSRLAKMQEAEINLFGEKITTFEVLKEVEIQEMKLMISELENDLSNLQQKLKLQEIETSLGAEKLETTGQLRISEALVEKLDNEKGNQLEDVKGLSSNRANLLGTIEELSDRISKLSSEDMQLMGILGRIVQTFDHNGMGIIDLKRDDDEEFFESVKENMMNIHLSPLTKKVEVSFDERWPLRTLNN